MKVPVSAVALVLFIFLGVVNTALASEYTRCELSFNADGWSFIYKTMTGSGVVTCGNGQSEAVAIETHAVGITAGRSEIDDGRGTFSSVKDISEIFGSYLAGEAHAGATRSAAASAMTKGPISLVISGMGRGVDLGVTLGAFTIKRP
jgi:hypothetical protein